MPKKLTIAGETFDVSTPYEPGHQISEIEAKVLNQTRAENVGNNLRADIKDALAAGKAFDELQVLVTKYDGEYNFSMGGSAREPIDPLERECRKVAREAIVEWLKTEEGGNRKVKEVDPEELEKAIDQVSAQEDTIAEAKKRIKAKAKKVNISLAGMGLGAQPSA